jgi:hypothetical protein
MNSLLPQNAAKNSAKKQPQNYWEHHIHPSFCLVLATSADQFKQTQLSHGDLMYPVMHRWAQTSLQVEYVMLYSDQHLICTGSHTQLLLVLSDIHIC